jgi:hypothetical protein
MRPALRSLGLLAVILVASWPLAGWARSKEPIVEPNDQIVLSGDVTVQRGRVVGEIVVFHGSATVAGVVDGDVVVVDGPVLIKGFVNGSVVAADGSVHLAASAKVGGDVIARERVVFTEGATVLGQVREHAAFSLAGPLAGLGSLLAPLAIAVSGLLVALTLLALTPRGAEKVALAVRTAPIASALWGLAAWVGVPALAFAACVTVLGLPLGLSLILGVGLLSIVGYAWSIWGVGRLLVREPRPRLLAVAAGWAVLAAIGLVPILNVVTWLGASVLGVGGMIVAAWRVRGGNSGRHRVGGSRPLDEPVSDATVAP